MYSTNRNNRQLNNSNNNNNNLVGSNQRLPRDKYERFEVWLKENGAQFNLVSFFF